LIKRGELFEDGKWWGGISWCGRELLERQVVGDGK
jgi:hypothetical protein